MSAQPSPRPAPRRPRPHLEALPGAGRLEEIDRAARVERRRRLNHLRRRRRDLLEDCGAAVILMILALIITPGLGMLAILEVPVAMVLLATVLVERRRRRRRLAARRYRERARPD